MSSTVRLPSHAPLDPNALARAHSLHRQGLLAEAEALYRHILQAQPQQVDALQLLGLIEAQNQRSVEAVALFDAALALRPDLVAAWFNRGISLQTLKRSADAIGSYDRVLALQPEHAKAQYSRAFLLHELQRNAEALDGFEVLLRASPQHFEALYGRSVVLQHLGRHGEAVAGYESCLAMAPDHVDALFNRSLVLHQLNRTADALDGYDRVLALKPDHTEAVFGRGVALQACGRHRQAQDDYGRACELQPQHERAHLNRSLCALLLGDFDTGWPGYEWRFCQTEQVAPIRDFGVPRWQGDPEIRGKTILLHAEQGLGDTIQFGRYIEQVAALGASVLLEVQPPLQVLLADIDGAETVLAHGDALPVVDLHCSLLSLPLAFGTRLDTIPAPLTLRAAPSQVQAWRQRLGDDPRLRVGLVWSGSPLHLNDVNRSIPLADFSALLCDGVAFYSLQPELRDSDRAALDAHPELRHFGSELRQFTDTAALIEAMDVVITVDTSVAHLAGTMGKPVWILLSATPDWRWMLGRDDSPWYPTVRLFRQPAVGDWPSVLDRVRAALAGLVEQHPR